MTTRITWQRKHLVIVKEIWTADIDPEILDLARQDTIVFDFGDLDELVTRVGTLQESTIIGEPVDNELEYEEVPE